MRVQQIQHEFFGYIFSRNGFSPDPKTHQRHRSLVLQPPQRSHHNCRCQPCNAGPGAILCQDNHVVAYASRSLTPVEQRYSQTEREALGVLFACEHFHLYIYGAKFNIITDHKPLERIFTNPAARSNARLERWALKLQPYHFTISYSPGKTNPADYLSRHPLATTHPSTASDQAEEYIAFLADHTTPKAMTVYEVK